MALDTPVFVYALEGHPRFGPPAETVLEAIMAGELSAIASTLLLAELLVVPYRARQAGIAASYVRQLASFPNLTLVPPGLEVCLRAAQLRASVPSLKLPDALHVATALESAATAFVTNDARIADVAGLAVVQLADLAPQSGRRIKPGAG